VPHDDRQAVVWFKRAANHGDIRALAILQRYWPTYMHVRSLLEHPTRVIPLLNTKWPCDMLMVKACRRTTRTQWHGSGKGKLDILTPFTIVLPRPRLSVFAPGSPREFSQSSGRRDYQK
jgi:hypothetical protein